MKNLTEYLNESIYGKLMGLKNKSKLVFKDAINNIKKDADRIMTKLKNQKLVISANNLNDYNAQCKELMDICSNSDDRIEALKMYFVPNSDDSMGEYTIYVVADEEEIKTYVEIPDWENSKGYDFPDLKKVYSSFKMNTYYKIYFDSENNMTMVKSDGKKDAVKEFNKKYKDLGFRVTSKLDKWVCALKDLSEIYR